MMKIILEKSKCIGCGSCVVVCSEYFELGEDGKSHLKGEKVNFLDSGNEKSEELEISEGKDCPREAASVCPMEAIKIID